MDISLTETLIILACCSIPLLLLIGAGLIFALVKLGVIGSYWLKGQETQSGGEYTLDQSRAVSSEEEG